MLGLALVAVALGTTNLAAAVGIGVAHLDGRTRGRVAVVFGVCETATPLAGLLLGRRAAGALGSAAPDVAAVLLVAIGVVTAWRAARARPGPALADHLGGLVATGVALSLDNLAVGFALGSFHVDLVAAALVVGLVSVAMTLVGLELGHRLGRVAGRPGEVLAGAVLVGVGVAVAAGWLG